MNITIDQIICLKTVYGEGSLTKAATKLNRAKSAINYSLNNLEEQLGFKLLDKSGYRPKSTPRGEEFLFKSKNILDEYEILIGCIQKIISGVEMKISISISANCTTDKMYKTVKQAITSFPATEVTLQREVLSGEELLRKGLVDIALYESVGAPVDFEFKKLGDINLPLYIAKTHPFLTLPKKEQTKRQLKKYPQIIMSSTSVETNLSRGVDGEGLKWFVSDIGSKMDLITKGLGWGRLPDHLVNQNKLTHLKWLDDLGKISFYISRQKNKEHGEVSNFIWNKFVK
ncbi:MAG: hypothetical protein DRQ89_11320 [Epsilonproteobacteria bacterium]|nr:MAG: hypothetical protein DRQ89_11320 [Campylobacterota bacterium]